VTIEESSNEQIGQCQAGDPGEGLLAGLLSRSRAGLRVLSPSTRRRRMAHHLRSSPSPDRIRWRTACRPTSFRSPLEASEQRKRAIARHERPGLQNLAEPRP